MIQSSESSEFLIMPKSKIPSPQSSVSTKSSPSPNSQMYWVGVDIIIHNLHIYVHFKILPQAIIKGENTAMQLQERENTAKQS